MRLAGITRARRPEQLPTSMLAAAMMPLQEM
jgi:hypothetical protein